MADPATTIAAGAAAAAAAGASAHALGYPPQDQIIWGLLGGVASVWLTGALAGDVTWRKAGGALMHILISAVVGIALCVLLLHIAPKYDWLEPLAHAPAWALTCLLATMATKVGPWVVQTIGRWASGRFGGGTP